MATLTDTTATEPQRHGATNVRPGRSRRPRLLRRPRQETLAAYGFLAPDGIGLFVFLVVPMFLALGMGFFETTGFGTYHFNGLDNYARMASDPLLWNSLRVTGIYAGLYVPIVFVVSLVLAILVRDAFPGVGFARTAFFLPNVVSLIVIGLLWQFLLVDKKGLVSTLLEPFGLGGLSWLGSPKLALLTLVLISVWFFMGYYMLIFLAGLQDIPKEYYEAARVDGASAWQRFRHVTWPMLKPTSFFVLVVTLINAVSGLQAFDLVYATTKGGPANATSTIVFYIYAQAFDHGNYGYAAAITSSLVAVLVVITGTLFALTRGGRFDVN